MADAAAAAARLRAGDLALSSAELIAVMERVKRGNLSIDAALSEALALDAAARPPGESERELREMFMIWSLKRGKQSKGCKEWKGCQGSDWCVEWRFGPTWSALVVPACPTHRVKSESGVGGLVGNGRQLGRFVHQRARRKCGWTDSVGGDNSWRGLVWAIQEEVEVEKE